MVIIEPTFNRSHVFGSVFIIAQRQVSSISDILMTRTGLQTIKQYRLNKSGSGMRFIAGGLD